MTKQEAEEYAKKAVRILKKRAIKYAKHHGEVPSHGASMTTGKLVQELEIPIDSWSARASVRAALTRALNEAVSLGLVERRTAFSYSGDKPAWTYVGPDVKKAAEARQKDFREKEKLLAEDLKALGLPVRKSSRRGGGIRLDFTSADIKRALRRRR